MLRWMQYHVDNGSTTAEPESSIPSVLEEYGGGGAVESTQTGRSRPAHSDSWEGMRRRVMTCMEHPSSVQRPASSVQRPASSISISIHQGSRCDPAASWYPDLPDPEIHRAHLGARTRLIETPSAAMTPSCGWNNVQGTPPPDAQLATKRREMTRWRAGNLANGTRHRSRNATPNLIEALRGRWHPHVVLMEGSRTPRRAARNRRAAPDWGLMGYCATIGKIVKGGGGFGK